ncbi:TRAP transporter small permease [Litoreibacter roseus]|nr:TRAP transporter small permease subunit [Litoreibacter roseus]
MLAVTRALAAVNALVLAIGRFISIGLMGFMVLVILLQVFFRYILNDALPWSEEAARFMMLWMTGLVAPSAYRWGGFVAIEMVPQMLPKRIGALLMLFLLVVAGLVLVVAVQLGWKHVNSGWLFNSSSLKIPMDLFGMKVVRVKLAWMYMSLFVGVILLLSVNVELILRTLAKFADREDELPEIKPLMAVEAE